MRRIKSKLLCVTKITNNNYYYYDIVWEVIYVYEDIFFTFTYHVTIMLPLTELLNRGNGILYILLCLLRANYQLIYAWVDDFLKSVMISAIISIKTENEVL